MVHPFTFFNKKVLYNEPFQLYKERFCRKKGNAMHLCSLKQVTNKEKRKNNSMEMVMPVTLSSRNKTIQSNIEHYVEKSHCQKENNLDDVMGVSNSKEHAGQHRLWFTTIRSHSCLLLLPFAPKTSFLSDSNLQGLPHNPVSQSNHSSWHGSCCTGHQTGRESGTIHTRARQASGRDGGVCVYVVHKHHL